MAGTCHNCGHDEVFGGAPDYGRCPKCGVITNAKVATKWNWMAKPRGNNRVGYVNAKINKKKKGVDKGDYVEWDCTFSAAGVFNGGKRTNETVEDMINYMNSMRVMLGHPPMEDMLAMTGAALDHPDYPVIGFTHSAVVNYKKTKWGDRATADGKLCVYKDKHGQDNQWIIDAINSGAVSNVSIGFYYTHEEESGTFMGLDYDHVETNVSSFHIAILIDEPPACGPAEGCGIHQQAIGGKTMGNEKKDTPEGDKTKEPASPQDSKGVTVNVNTGPSPPEPIGEPLIQVEALDPATSSVACLAKVNPEAAAMAKRLQELEDADKTRQEEAAKEDAAHREEVITTLRDSMGDDFTTTFGEDPTDIPTDELDRWVEHFPGENTDTPATAPQTLKGARGPGKPGTNQSLRDELIGERKGETAESQVVFNKYRRKAVTFENQGGFEPMPKPDKKDK